MRPWIEQVLNLDTLIWDGIHFYQAKLKTSPSFILLTSYQIFLSRLCNQKEIQVDLVTGASVLEVELSSRFSEMLQLTPMTVPTKSVAYFCDNTGLERKGYHEIGFHISEQGESVWFSGRSFSLKTAEVIQARFLSFLKQLFSLENVNTPVGDISVLSSHDFAVLKELNATTVSFDPSLTADQVLRQVFGRHPNKVAVSLEGSSWTYGELSAQSELLAHRLSQIGVKPEDVIGLCAEGSFALVVGMVGILLSGGAYCPFLSDDPPSRRETILKEIRTRIVVTTREYAELFTPFQATVKLVFMDLPEEKSHITTLIDKKEQAGVSPKNLAYVLYTSGSTGAPKYIQVDHFALCHYAVSLSSKGYMRPGDVVIQLSKLSFDVHIQDIFVTLMLGGQVVLLKPRGSLDFEYLVDQIEHHKVSFMECVPSLFGAVGEYLSSSNRWQVLRSVRRVIAAGEPLPPKLVDTYMKNGRCVTNGYGPAECPILTSSYEPNPEDVKLSAIPIGKPLPNYKCFVLDTRGNQVPVGCVGELYIGGPSLFRGYLNRPDLSEKALVKKSFFDGLLYRSGDLVRCREDGNLLFHGRVDFQVKIRGQRLEPGEIESVLAKHESVLNAVVMKQDKKQGGPFLVGYFSAKSKLKKPN